MAVNWNIIHAVIADMDGVLWRGSEPLPGAKAFFAYLFAEDIPYCFATNNSSRTVDYYVEKLNGMGIQAEAEQIISSGTATAAFLQQNYPDGAELHVVGEDGLRQILTEHGFTVVEGDEGQPRVVVAGIDRSFSYDKLRIAAAHIRAGSRFIGTNADKTFPIPNGVAPGAGSILAALEAASGTSPKIIGKPSAPMFEIALERLGTKPQNTLMLGDRIETDIIGAKALGMQTALVLSGVSAQQDIKSKEDSPGSIYQHLGHLYERIIKPIKD